MRAACSTSARNTVTIHRHTNLILTHLNGSLKNEEKHRCSRTYHWDQRKRADGILLFLEEHGILFVGANPCEYLLQRYVKTFATRARKRGSTDQSACRGWLCQASGDLANTCLPSRLISWFEPRLPLLPLQLCPFNTLLRLFLKILLKVDTSIM
jgi:hypothetical protein